MIEVFVVDDNPLMRKMLRQLVETEEDCRATAEAESVEGALSIIDQGNSFDVILADISLYGKEGGIQLVEQIRQRGNTTPILSVSLHEQSLYEEPLRKAGAQGYLMKQDAVDNILTAIRSLASGGSYWPTVVERH